MYAWHLAIPGWISPTTACLLDKRVFLLSSVQALDELRRRLRLSCIVISIRQCIPLVAARLRGQKGVQCPVTGQVASRKNNHRTKGIKKEEKEDEEEE
jgi:hypothetical protein